MGSDDYSAAVGGGLKLKGSKPSGVTKKKKKDKDKSKSKEESTATALQDALAGKERPPASADKTLAAADRETIEEDHVQDQEEEDAAEEVSGGGKTEAERKYDEMKRKRLDERLRKEGVKTHKQRVEELNKYLSTLSEHHDMPRIGPG